ncbi:MAG: 2-dehydropantoate 2-reductase [Bacteroides sp.]|nr:2-dehydropantoate 2-reductase [Bacteroides sp.]MDD2645389.1 2-dehydropantoate 2-reductase [Bacteroides sp.]MDD4054403.1 2-dehydropantoate 2-reductase [Bacteroides sp.]MDD4719398.1 2-dehydropantoate 2-reductase [Bacteroides sp.]
MSTVLKYLVIGAGGVGGNLAAFLTLSKKNVSLIARGKNLDVLQKDGLTLQSDLFGEVRVQNIVALAETDYYEKPDVIFLCTKGYSIEDTIPFLNRVVSEHTLVIPLLNGFHIGRSIQERLHRGVVLEGCIYILGTLLQPGVVRQQNSIFRIVFGVPNNGTKPSLEIIKKIESDLKESRIKVNVSDDIELDTFMKWSFISATALVGAYFNQTMGALQREGDSRDAFIKLSSECESLAIAMNLKLPKSLVEANLQVLHNTAEEATSSMQKDIASGKESEIKALVFDVISLGNQYNVSMPTYKKLSEKFK